MSLPNIIFGNNSTSALAYIFILPYVLSIIMLIIFGYSIYVRRLHDMNMSAWWILLNLIPFGCTSLCVFIGGTKGENRYGEQPSKRIKFPSVLLNLKYSEIETKKIEEYRVEKIDKKY